MKAVLKPSYSKHIYKNNKRSLMCPIDLEISDIRTEKSFFYKTLSSKDLESWIHSIFENLYPLVSPTENKEASDNLFLKLQIAVEKAYINHYSTSISGVIAFHASVNGETKYYRGQKQAGNMWGATSEYNSLLNRALSIALDKLYLELNSLCNLKQ